MFNKPRFNRLEVLYPVVIQCQEKFTVRILCQAFNNYQEFSRIDFFFIDHEPKFAIVGYRGKQMYTLLFGIKPDRRYFEMQRITLPIVFAIAKSDCVYPFDLGMLFFLC